jgi:hypothetical protein
MNPLRLPHLSPARERFGSWEQIMLSGNLESSSCIDFAIAILPDATHRN